MTNLVSISPHQFDILYKLPFATAPLSLIGSSLVLLCVARHTPEKRCNVYHRLLIGLSVLDVIFSTCYSLSYVPHPEGMPPGYGFGNTATCAAQAFFVQVGSLSYAYSMCLAIYYVLVIRFNRREAWIATYVEPVMHFAIISFALISGIVNITGKYGNGGLPTCCKYSAVQCSAVQYMHGMHTCIVCVFISMSFFYCSMMMRLRYCNLHFLARK